MEDYRRGPKWPRLGDKILWVLINLVSGVGRGGVLALPAQWHLFACVSMFRLSLLRSLVI